MQSWWRCRLYSGCVIHGAEHELHNNVGFTHGEALISQCFIIRCTWGSKHWLIYFQVWTSRYERTHFSTGRLTSLWQSFEPRGWKVNSCGTKHRERFKFGSHFQEVANLKLLYSVIHTFWNPDLKWLYFYFFLEFPLKFHDFVIGVPSTKCC